MQNKISLCLNMSIVCEPLVEEETQLTKPSTNLDISPKSEPTLELHSMAAPTAPTQEEIPEEGG